MQHSTTLRPLEASEIDEVVELARTVWRQHYATILSSVQIEYMLRDKYTESDLARYPSATDRWFDVLIVDGVLSGFLRTLRISSKRFKLEEIYLTQAMRGQGYGKILLERAESLAREHGCQVVFLYVNRANTASITMYQKNGYEITESEIFDIGKGFVMDDHLMEKSIVS